MNKLNLILRAISCGSLLLTSGSVIYNANQPEAVTVAETQSEDPNKIVTDNGHGTVTVETKPGDSHYVDNNVEEQTPVNATPPTTPQPTYTEPTIYYSPTAGATYEPIPTYRFSNIHDFERAYIYQCPQDVPAGEFHLPLPKYVALGYIGSYINYNDLQTAAIYAWTLIVGGFGGQTLEVYPNWAGLSSYPLVVDPATRNVTWKSYVSVSDDTKAQLETVSAQLQSEIKSLDQQYYAKCGY